MLADYLPHYLMLGKKINNAVENLDVYSVCLLFLALLCVVVAELDCGLPPSISRGQFVLDKKTGSAVYSCDVGFRMESGNSAPATAKCALEGKTRGIWFSGKVPATALSCHGMLSLSHSSVLSFSFYLLSLLFL